MNQQLARWTVRNLHLSLALWFTHACRPRGLNSFSLALPLLTHCVIAPLSKPRRLITPYSGAASQSRGSRSV